MLIIPLHFGIYDLWKFWFNFNSTCFLYKLFRVNQHKQIEYITTVYIHFSSQLTSRGQLKVENDTSQGSVPKEEKAGGTS